MNRELVESLILIAAGYLAGSMLFGYFLPKYLKNMDIEQISEDHNPGTANVMKYAGIPLGLLCLFLDVMKWYLLLWCAARVVRPVSLAFAGIMAAPVIGHAFPFWRNHRGGKAIAVTFGVLLGIRQFSPSIWVLAAIYIFLSVVLVVRPNERRSVYTFFLFGAVSAASLFFGGLPGICVGNILIAAVVINRNWAGACFGRTLQEEKRRIRNADS